MKNIIALVSILLVFNSCEKSKASKQVSITNFNEKFTDSLIPDPDNKNYFRFQLEVKGTSNDSIRVSVSSSKVNKPSETTHFYFTGEFKEAKYLDYYGDSNMYITFDPFKASDGEVKLEFSL